MAAYGARLKAGRVALRALARALVAAGPQAALALVHPGGAAAAGAERLENGGVQQQQQGQQQQQQQQQGQQQQGQQGPMAALCLPGSAPEAEAEGGYGTGGEGAAGGWARGKGTQQELLYTCTSRQWRSVETNWLWRSTSSLFQHSPSQRWA